MLLLNYDDSGVKRKATLDISPYKPTDALMVGERIVTSGKSIVLENVASTGKVRVEISGTIYEISGTGIYEGLEITIDDFYYTDVLENRWVKLSFGGSGVITTLTQTTEIQEITTTTVPKTPEDSYNIFQQIVNWFFRLFSR